MIDKEKILQELIAEHNVVVKQMLEKHHLQQYWQYRDSNEYIAPKACPSSVYEYSSMFLDKIKNILATI